MTTIHHTAVRRMRLCAGAFTLTELLTVVAILAILMAMLTPTLHEAIIVAQRGAVCRNNIHSVIGAANLFAQDDEHKRLPTIKPTTANWGDMRLGNPGCLSLLIDDKFAARELFLCPEAKSTRGFEAMPLDANFFTYKNNVSTLSYSFISMVYKSQWKTIATPEGNLGSIMTTERVPGTLVVLADQNPRCTLGVTGTLKSYQTLKSNSGGLLTEDTCRNSPNHAHKGQNMGRWDQSVSWRTDPNSPGTTDDIYSSSASSGDEALGRRKDMDDAFLIP